MYLFSPWYTGDLWQVDVFFPDTQVSSTNKTNSHDITEILLKGALNTINQTKKKKNILKIAN